MYKRNGPPERGKKSGGQTKPGGQGRGRGRIIYHQTIVQKGEIDKRAQGMGAKKQGHFSKGAQDKRPGRGKKKKKSKKK